MASATPVTEPGGICPFCASIEAGRLTEVRKYIQAERDVCHCEGMKPVYRVIKFYQRFLREAGMDFMAKSVLWRCPSIYRSETRLLVLEVIAKLLAGGAAVNYTTGLETPLMAALCTCDEDLLWLLLDFNADVNLCDGVEDMNALGLAILLNEVNLVEMLLKQGAKVNSLCCGNLVPIQLAMNKNSAVSNLLIQYGADVHQLRTVSLDDKVFTSQSPLHVAILRKNVHLGRLLLEHGEDVNQTFNDSLESPIHQAVRNLDLDMIDLLIEYGADLNRPNFERHTPIGLSLLTDDAVSTEIAKRLILAGASPNQRTRISFFQKTYSPLHIACFKGNLEFVRFLVEEVCSKMGYWDEEMEAPVSESAKVGSKERCVASDNPTCSIQERYFKLLPRNDRCWGTTPSTTSSVGVRRGSTPSITEHCTTNAGHSFLQERKDYHVRSEVSPSSSTVVDREEGAVGGASSCRDDEVGLSDMGSVKAGGEGARVDPSSSLTDVQNPAVHCTILCSSCQHIQRDHGANNASLVNQTKTCKDRPKEKNEAYSNIVFIIGDEALDKSIVKKHSTSGTAKTANSNVRCENCGYSKPVACESTASVVTSQSCALPSPETPLSAGNGNSVSPSGTTARNCSQKSTVLKSHTSQSNLTTLRGQADSLSPNVAPSPSSASEGLQDTRTQSADDNLMTQGVTSTETGAAGGNAGPASDEPVFQAEFGSPDYDYQVMNAAWQDHVAQQDRGDREVEAKHHSIVRFLNQVGSDGSTALFMAVYDGNVELVEYLLGNGANPHFSSMHGNFFHAAVLSQSIPLIRRALELGCDINEHNMFGNSPLTLMSRLDLPEACELFVVNGTDLNTRDRYGETPLLASVYFGCEMNARMLIQHGAALDLVDDNNTSAIYWSIFNNRQRTLKLLLMAGASFTPQVFRQYPRNIRVMNNPYLFNFIQQCVHQPRSLQDLATIRIRVHMSQVKEGRSILSGVELLPIPNRLKEMLRLQHFIQIIEAEADELEGDFLK